MPATTNARVRMGDITDTGRTTEVEVIGYQEMNRMRELYKTVTLNRRGPPESTEPTKEQMSADLGLLEERAPPFADFAIWGPYGDRTQ